MTKPKISAKAYAASLVAARKASGDSSQSHWLDRLKAVMTRPPKPAKNDKAKG
jgi:hypothetical protein